MNWYQHAHNPQAITSIFSAAPALEKVRLAGADLRPASREAKVFVELLEFPDKPSPRWTGKGFTVAQVQMDFFCVGPLEVSGWETDEIITIEVAENRAGRLSFNAKGAHCRFHFSCASFRIASVSGYNSGRREESEQRVSQ